ncbi:MAG: GNAT family N-acetyltransferase [Janthinobacterium lividum]
MPPDRRDGTGVQADTVVERREGEAQAHGAPVSLRVACIADVPKMQALIERSASGLNAGHYAPGELDAAIRDIFGVDTRLVEDGTYFVAERAGVVVGCGGWSQRRTLFGGDRFAGREDAALDPATDAARIRAMFVDPAHARTGVATALLAASEAAAGAAGFRRLALMATLPGLAFYRAAGFVAGEPIRHPSGDAFVPFVPMTKQLSDPTGTIRRPASPQADQRSGRAML